MTINNYRDLLGDQPSSPEISSFIVLLRRAGIGRSLSRQKFELTAAEQAIIVRAISLWRDFSSLIELTAMPKDRLHTLLQRLAFIVAKQQPLSLVSIFCPSYKMGEGAIGYNYTIGSTTRHNIARLHQIQEVCQRYNLPCTVTIYFSDLVLENYSSLQGTDYSQALACTYQSLIEASVGWNISLLSTLGTLRASVGEAGATIDKQLISAHDLAIVLERSKIFYQDKLGWSEAQTKQRSQDLAITYPYLAEAVSQEHPTSIYYWSESAWERALLMPNLTLPIIFPRKEPNA